MKNLNELIWKEFDIGGKSGLFKITATSSGIDKNKLVMSNDGKIPYITRTDMSNGINQFIPDKQNTKYKKDKSNVITIGLDTQTVFYQESEFFTGQNIQVVRNKELNKANAFFLIPLLKIQMEKFNWGGNGATLGRLSRTKIMLPIDDSRNEPDYEYMEQYTKAIIEEKIAKYTTYAKSISNTIKVREIEKLEDKEWKEFQIGKLFKTLVPGKSKGLTHLKKVSDGINYLGATNLNNGVLTYVSTNGNEKMIQKGNCIAFIRNGDGSVGYSIYKAEDFISTSDISLGYSEHLNKYIGLFITTVADKVRSKYSFGYKRSAERLKKERILLPVNDKNEPDYEYMEQYAKNLMHKKIKQYLDYLQKQNS